jgi:hypothetical protein
VAYHARRKGPDLTGIKISFNFALDAKGKEAMIY